MAAEDESEEGTGRWKIGIGYVMSIGGTVVIVPVLSADIIELGRGNAVWWKCLLPISDVG